MISLRSCKPIRRPSKSQIDVPIAMIPNIPNCKIIDMIIIPNVLKVSAIETGVKPVTLKALTATKIVSIREIDTPRSEEHTSELQSRGHLVCRLLLEKKKKRRQL